VGLEYERKWSMRGVEEYEREYESKDDERAGRMRGNVV